MGQGLIVLIAIDKSYLSTRMCLYVRVVMDTNWYTDGSTGKYFDGQR